VSARGRVLLVDDRPEILGFMLLGLELAGFEVEVARSGEEALARLGEHGADVVVTDIFMPEMDGLEAIDRIKARFPRTRIVAMSSGAAGMQDYLASARLIGADATLLKPFATSELVRLVRELSGQVAEDAPRQPAGI
jgi:CheY-like chemotaxis protein